MNQKVKIRPNVISREKLFMFNDFFFCILIVFFHSYRI